MIIHKLQESPNDGNLGNTVRNRLETIPKLAIRTYSKIFIQPWESDFFNFKGTFIFERDWDLLIVLDSCRADLIQSFEAKYPFIDFNTEFSPGGATYMWLEKNFGERFRDEMEDAIYVMGNPYSARRLYPQNFLLLDEVWRYAWDEEIGTIRPRPLTDRTITLAREYDPERLIVHYMQPHFPSIPHPEFDSELDKDNINQPWTDSVWNQLGDNQVRKSDAWTAYRDNLELVLDDVELLLNNVDADRAIITSDHGNAFGEFGFYGHPPEIPLHCIREVPWCVTTGKDHQEYTPESYDEKIEQTSEQAIERKLASLGYVE